MKNTQIKIENNGTFIKFDLDTNNTKDNNKVRRALVYRFFDYYNTMRVLGAKGFKGNEPFVVTILIDGQLQFTSANLTTQVQTRLKLINNPKGRERFDFALDTIIAMAQRFESTNVDAIIKDVATRLLEA